MNVFSLSWAAAGLALLGLSLFPAGSLALGGAPAHLAVFLLLLALAAQARRLLRREGLDRPRLLDALLPIGLAFFLRALLLDYQSADYQMFLSQWAAAFRDGGGFAAVKLPIGNYNAPYLYFLAAISYLPIPDLYLIKLFSILFDVVLATGAYSESNYAVTQSGDTDDIQTPSAALNDALRASAKAAGIPLIEGNIHSSDVFYRQPSDEKPTYWEKLRDEKGCLAVEMESFALFHNARVLGKRAACLLTISDSFVSPEITTAEQRQTSFTAMMKVALGVDAFLEK